MAMADYFDEVESAVKAEQAKDAGVVLPWSWWRVFADRHAMSVNAVYTRAVKIGLYVPPSHRGSKNGTSKAPSDAPIRSRSQQLARDASRDAAVAGGSSASSALSGVSDALLGYTRLMEDVARHERQLSEVTLERDRLRDENVRLKRAIDRLQRLNAHLVSEFGHTPDTETDDS